MKKLISIVLSIAIVFALTVPAFAVDASPAISDSVQTSSFIDGEGKLNTVGITIPQAGSAYVEYSIEGVLISTTCATIPDSGSTRNACDEVFITHTDVLTGTTQQYTESISKYISDSYQQTVMESVARAYTYLGTIAYNTHYYDSNGNPIIRNLSISQQAGTATYTYKTINAAAGATASVVIGVIASVLSLFIPGLGTLADKVLAAAAVAVGTTIVGGVIQGAISKRYYVHTTPYDVRATYTTAVGSTEHYFDAERYQVALEGGGYSSEYYYDGYLPWNNNTVAYMYYSAFWADGYAGVRGYS